MRVFYPYGPRPVCPGYFGPDPKRWASGHDPLSAVRSFLRPDAFRTLSTVIHSAVCDGPIKRPGVPRTATNGTGNGYQTYGDGP